MQDDIITTGIEKEDLVFRALPATMPSLTSASVHKDVEVKDKSGDRSSSLTFSAWLSSVGVVRIKVNFVVPIANQVTSENSGV